MRDSLRNPIEGIALIVGALIGMLAESASAGLVVGELPMVLADFEGEDYGLWVKTGEAFGPGSARGTLPGQMLVSGYLGEGLVNTFYKGDQSTGTLTSPEFHIERDKIAFLIGGGGFEGKTCINLLVDGKVVRTATGPNTEPGGSEHLRPHLWDVQDLRGKQAQIQIVDEATGGWGHINVDQIVLCNEPPEWPAERETLLARAEASVERAIPKAEADPSRPAFHFRPPTLWMNDPNGTIYLDGFHHVFYQHNPYGDSWGHMHWGHARSKDLVRWEHLPIALWPSKAEGEDHVFSGGAAVDGTGNLTLFYTSVGAGRPNEQWAALPIDEAGNAWKKHPDNPLITVDPPGGPTFGDGMRDPFLFEAEGRRFMVIGADTKTESVLPLYEAKEDDLADWDYLGILWSTPKVAMEFPECPNFFQVGDRWVLLLSPYRAVEYRVGSFDLDSLRFKPEVEGLLDASDQFYATNMAVDPDGRWIVFGWVRGFPEGRGWNGCLALPRILTIGPDGHPRQKPVPALESLRGSHQQAEAVRLEEDQPYRVPNLDGDFLEVFATFEPGEARRFGLKFEGDEAEAVVIVLEDGELKVSGQEVPLRDRNANDPLTLHAYLDRTVLEVFINDSRQCVTRVIPYSESGRRIEVFSEGGPTRLKSLKAWELTPIWPPAE